MININKNTPNKNNNNSSSSSNKTTTSTTTTVDAKSRRNDPCTTYCIGSGDCNGIHSGSFVVLVLKHRSPVRTIILCYVTCVSASWTMQTRCSAFSRLPYSNRSWGSLLRERKRTWPRYLNQSRANPVRPMSHPRPIHFSTP